jgi:phosphotransferase system IIB component
MHKKEIIRALGGIKNIRIVDSSPNCISVAVMDTHKIKPAVLMELGAYEVREAFFCHYIYFGPASIAIAREIKKEMKNFGQITKFIENK